MNITTKKVLRYTFMPQVLPRLRTLLSSSFGYISFFMAQIYGGVRLLPPHHPYLSAVNMGKFGIHHVIAQAAVNLRFKKENIDQIVVFVLLLAGMGILLAQLGLLALALFVNVAHAAAMPTNFAGFFITPNATDDVAYVLLDRVFGIPGLFLDSGGGATCVAAGFPCFQFPAATLSDITNPYATADGAWPTPFHFALHGMFQFYSFGLLVVAMLIFLYYVVAVAVETAESGTPFGRRFNHVWAPIRMVAALGLLVPVTNGLNAAQYIVLYAAKYGSGFATNGWNLFLAQIAAAPAPVGGQNTVAGDSNRLIVTPQPPDPIPLLEYITVLQTCWWAEGNLGGSGAESVPTDKTRRVCGWMVRNSGGAPAKDTLKPTTTYEQALNFYNNGDVRIVFGEYRMDGSTGAGTPAPLLDSTVGGDAEKWDFGGGTNYCVAGFVTGNPVYKEEQGEVKPICGDVILTTVATIDPAGNNSDPGAYYAQERYFELLKNLWFANSGNPCTDGFHGWGIGLAQRYALDVNPNFSGPDPLGNGDPAATIPDMNDLDCAINEARIYLTDTVNNAVAQEILLGNWAIGTAQQLGWGGAGTWYNRIAQINGALVNATGSLPYVRSWPAVMERVLKEKQAHDKTSSGRDRFKPFMSDGQAVNFERPSDAKVAKALWASYNLWREAGPKAAASSNILKDAIFFVFGLDGLYSMLDNPTTYPLAQLVGIGKSLVESSIRSLGYFAGTTFGEMVGLGQFASFASSFFFQVAMIGLGVGFVLFYVIPFLPFIYFFFAVGEWVKGIFEAMVGVPLWALAHIRIDGHGLPGDAAMGGYYLILEVFLRPIMIVFGLLGSIVIFAGQVFLLHEIWKLVVSNISGFDYAAAASAGAGATGSIEFARDIIDNFFYTVAYAIIVYMLAMSSFKLIDLVPDHILRWMGASVSTFGEKSGDPAENLVRNVAIGEQVATHAIGDAVGGAKGAIGQASAGLGKIIQTGKTDPG